MGTDHGKTGNIHALAIVAEAENAAIPTVGTTTFRPPYTPTTFGALAGRGVGALFDPVRQTPMHKWHARCGAVFEDVGQWKRAWSYPREAATCRKAVHPEVLGTGRGIGLPDLLNI